MYEYVEDALDRSEETLSKVKEEIKRKYIKISCFTCENSNKLQYGNGWVCPERGDQLFPSGRDDEIADQPCKKWTPKKKLMEEKFPDRA